MAAAGCGTSTHATTWYDAESGRRYEQGRPGYPAALSELLTDQLQLRAGSRLADLAAGTGKLTRRLVETPAQVTAVEPMPGMRAQLCRRAPEAQLIAARAELLPLASGSVDGVTVAQAFHWFDVPRASAELRRVLRPGGRLVLVTNKRHAARPWVRELWAVLARYERLAPRPPSTHNWRGALDATGDFGAFERFDLHNEQRFDDLADFDARFTSISFVILLSEANRRSLVRDLRAVVAGVDPLVVPLRTEVEIAVRRG